MTSAEQQAAATPLPATAADPVPSAPPDLLHQFLATTDEPCPACNYNLRGITGDTCPECGELLRLRVGIVEPRLAHFIAGLLGLAIGFGFFLVFAVAMGLSYIFDIFGGPPPLSTYWAFPACALLLGAATWWWIKRRTWSRRRTPAQRAALLAGAWLLTATCVTLVFAFVD